MTVLNQFVMRIPKSQSQAQPLSEMEGSVNILTLGCDKNRVDSERLAAQLQAAGYTVHLDDYNLPHPITIINTCGFINDAKEESVEAVHHRRSRNPTIWAIALPRWLIRFFSEASISAKVWPYPSGRKMGSYPKPSTPWRSSVISPSTLPSKK